MKSKTTITDVDFIGGLGSLTAEEERALSEYFKKKKLNTKSLGGNNKTRVAKRI